MPMEDFKGKPFKEVDAPCSLWYCDIHACHFLERCKEHPNECKQLPPPKVVKAPGQKDG